MFIEVLWCTGPLTSLEDGDSLFPTKVKVCKRDFSIFEM